MKIKIGTTCHKTGFEKTVIATLLSVVFTQIPAYSQEVQIPDGFPGKDNISLSLVTLPDYTPITTENTLMVGQYKYVNQVDQERWVVFFNDPVWNTLSTLTTLNDWNPEKGAAYPGKGQYFTKIQEVT